MISEPIAHWVTDYDAYEVKFEVDSIPCTVRVPGPMLNKTANRGTEVVLQVVTAEIIKVINEAQVINEAKAGVQ